MNPESDRGLEAVTRIAALVPPPRAKRDVDWGAARQLLGTELPAPYRALLDRFGPGYFDDRIELFAPDGDREGYAVLDRTRECAELNRFRREGDEPPRPMPYNDFPASRSLLTWGGLGEQGSLHWLVDGPPDSWVTVAQDWEEVDFVHIDLPAEAVVLRLLEDRLPEIDFADPAQTPHSFVSVDEITATPVAAERSGSVLGRLIDRLRG